MTTITLTSLFSELDNWPGRLFDTREGVAVVTATATQFSFRYTGGDFANFRIVVTGTGFQYDAGQAIAGNMTQVRILNAAGQTVITFGNIPADTLASDLSQFYGSVFGGTNPDGDGPQSDGQSAWSHLMSGNDVINGTSGEDDRALVGIDNGNDTYNMGDGDNYIQGGAGNDTINGGDDYDTFSFEETTYNNGQSAFQGIRVNMVTGTVIDCWGGTDRIFGIEAVHGSRFNDTFFGSDARDEFRGLRGNDTFRGGEEQDRLSYQSDYDNGGLRGIIVDLQTGVINGSIRGTIRDGFGNTDTTFDIERVRGTHFDDRFVGSTENNSFWGGEGRDFFNGDAGFDSVRFSQWFEDEEPTGINVNLTLATGQVRDDGFGNIETLVSIEQITGSFQNDVFRGNTADNAFSGEEGADLFTGGGGADTFDWYGDYVLGQGDRITDFAASGPAANIDILGFYVPEIDGMTDTLRLVNGTAATLDVGQFIFNAGNDTLFWDRDGTGSAAAVAVVVLTGVNTLSAANFELYL